MKQSVFIPFLLPGMNDIIRESKKRKGKWSGYADQKRDVQRQICLYFDDLLPVSSMVWVQFVWIEISRRRDLDNIAAAKKFIFDSLVEKKIIENDGWKNVCGWTDEFKVDKNNPGVRIEIIEV